MVRHGCAWLLLLTGLAGIAGAADRRDVATAPVRLAGLAVALPPGASPELVRTAEGLILTLRAVTGGEHALRRDAVDDAGAVLVGTAALLGRDIGFDPKHPGERQGYVIETGRDGVAIVGATDAAVRYGCADFLYRLGVRRYLPGPHWGFVPRQPDIAFGANVRDVPDFYTRRTAPVTTPDDDLFADWNIFNRTGGFHLRTSHEFQTIHRRNPEVFAEHPEYLGLVDGKRTSAQFCLSNPGLRKFLADYVVNHFVRRPEEDSCSLEPCDGGRWCECEPCAALGTPSDRMALAASECSRALAIGHPGKKIAFYAYNRHSPPPTRSLEKDIVVSVATRMTVGGFDTRRLLEGWGAAGAELGIRDYGAVFLWTWDLPGAAPITDARAHAAAKRDYHAWGARYYIDNTTPAWGASGWGYYLASRTAWNLDEQEHFDARIKEFLTLMFGPAREAMRGFYEQLDGGRRRALSEDVIGRLYRALAAAYALTEANETIQRRLDDLTLLARYAELTMHWRQSPHDVKAADALMDFVFAHASSRMFDLKRVREGVTRRSPGYAIKEKPEHSTDRAARRALVAQGVTDNPLIPFATVGYAGDSLVPLRGEGRARPTTLEMRWRRDALLWLEPGETAFKATNGLIEKYRNRGNLKLELLRFTNEGTDEAGDAETVVWRDESVVPDGRERELRVTVKRAGLHRLVIDDGGDKSRVTFPETVPMVHDTQSGRQRLYGDWVFYVPKGTRVVGLYADGGGAIHGPDGKIRLNLRQAGPGYHAVDVPEGQDGQVWRLNRSAAIVSLLTVPPFVASSPATLLVPSDME